MRGERGKKTHDYFFMVRIKNPAGGRLSPAQWLALDDAADQFADGTLRITSRQGIQYHHVYGPKLAPLMRHLNRNYRGEATLGACGDVNRNVMCSPIDGLDPAARLARIELAARDRRRARAAHERLLRGVPVRRRRQHLAPMNPSEPLYGEQYLPRKFKIGIAHPTDNSVDLLTQDIGFVPADARRRAAGTSTRAAASA